MQQSNGQSNADDGEEEEREVRGFVRSELGRRRKGVGSSFGWVGRVEEEGVFGDGCCDGGGDVGLRGGERVRRGGRGVG